MYKLYTVKSPSISATHELSSMLWFIVRLFGLSKFYHILVLRGWQIANKFYLSFMSWFVVVVVVRGIYVIISTNIISLAHIVPCSFHVPKPNSFCSGLNFEFTFASRSFFRHKIYLWTRFTFRLNFHKTFPEESPQPYTLKLIHANRI